MDHPYYATIVKEMDSLERPVNGFLKALSSSPTSLDSI
jgi:hypothetical protein